MTKRATDVIGKPVVAADTGKKLGTVENLLLDEDTTEVGGVLLNQGFLKRKDVLPAEAIQSLGRDAVVSRSSALADPQHWNREPSEPVSGQDVAEPVRRNRRNDSV